MKSTRSYGLVCGLLLVGIAAPAASLSAAISLELRPAFQVVNPGDYADLELYAVATSGSDELMSAADVLITWDPAYLDLVGVDQTGATPLSISGFPIADLWGNINDGQSVPTDGTGYYTAWGPLFGDPIVVTPAGTLLTTFLIDAIAPTPGTLFSIVPTLGNGSKTAVFDGETPNLEVTGSLSSAEIVILPEPATLSLLGLGMLLLRRRAVA
jgi:hypothetical protein